MRTKLSFIVFSSGAVVMAFEIVGSRVLAPYYGTSVIVWTALIGIILGALSLGYWLGGNLADKAPDKERLALVLLAAGLAIALTTFFKDIFLLWFSSMVPNLYAGTLISTTFLFFIPSTLLGMVTPFAVRLAITKVEKSGTTVGNLYALSTLGSIVGTFSAGFFLLPLAGHTALLGGMAIIEASLALLLSRKPKYFIGFLIVVIFGVGAVHTTAGKLNGMIDVDTRYARVTIYDEELSPDLTIRRMRIGDENSSARYLEQDDLAHSYTKFYRLVDAYVPEISNALLIGGAGYSYPRDFLSKHPDARMDVVEIDSGVTKLAREYFGLTDSNRLEIFHEDGRMFLNRNDKKYDAVFVDAYRGSVVPYHLASQEAIGRLANAVTDDGAVLINVISSIKGRDGRFLRSLLATLDKEFVSVEIFHVPAKYDPKSIANLILVARKSNTESPRSVNPEISGYLTHRWNVPVERSRVLTDDLNPTDFYLTSVVATLKAN